MKGKLQKIVQDSLNTLNLQSNNIRIDHTKDKTQGDFATNIAMVLCKQVQISPKDLAQQIIDNIAKNDIINTIEVAGPGFINFFMNSAASNSVISDILENADNFGINTPNSKDRILLEFVSANPTGPLHVGHGRGAAYGASVANLLRSVGHNVDCEYYVNDAGRQMDILATSVYLRYIETDKFPDNGYKGDYILKISAKINNIEKIDIFNNICLDAKDGGDKEQHIDDLIANCKQSLGADYKKIFNLAIKYILQLIKDDLTDFGVEYQRWFSEQSLIDDNLSQNIIKKLENSNHIYQKDGAKWFKTTDFGDEKDRVVVRKNGLHTYFASDIAYHLDKFERGYDKIINVWGADHHGYIARIKASISALNHDPEKLEILLVQFANLYLNGEKIAMSTRNGSFVELKELREEIGNDCARFFYIMRKSDQHMDFDLDLAKSRTNENPVFYIQYAHARICSVLAKVTTKNGTIDFALLNLEVEKELIKELGKYTRVLELSAKNYEPHLLAYYLRDLAGKFHSYYNNSEFLVNNVNLQTTRISLITATKQILKNGLNILGVSAAKKM